MDVLEVKQQSTLWQITLNRPEVHNALNLDLVMALKKTFLAAQKTPTLRVIHLNGNGASFCAGGDLNWMRAGLGKGKKISQQQLRDSQALADMYEAIFQSPVPVVANVHGNIMGGGVGLLAVCDLVVAEKSSRLCLSEVKLGLVPSVISPYLLYKLPIGKLLPLMLTAELFDADRALDLGLLHFVGTQAECDVHAHSLLQRIIDNGPQAVRRTKQLVHELTGLAGAPSGWSKQRRLSVKVNSHMRRSDEGQEGMRAFLEKRPANWRPS